MGFTKDGAGAFDCLVASYAVSSGRVSQAGSLRLSVLVKPGAPARTVRAEEYNSGDFGDSKPDDVQKKAWDAAESDTNADDEPTPLAKELEALRHAEVRGVQLPATIHGKHEVKLSVDAPKGACGPRRLRADTGSGAVVVLELACARKGAKAYDAASAVWNATGDALALAWTSDVDDPGMKARLALLRPENFAGLDLLDAGAKDLDGVRRKLTGADQRILHEAKAVKPRPTSAVYFAKGSEAQAKTVAAALGLPESAAQPLTWTTPYAITVAVGAQ